MLCFLLDRSSGWAPNGGLRNNLATGLFRRPYRNFVLDAGHPGYSAHVRLSERPLVRPFDYALQSNPAAVHFGGYSVTQGLRYPNEVHLRLRREYPAWRALPGY